MRSTQKVSRAAAPSNVDSASESTKVSPSSGRSTSVICCGEIFMSLLAPFGSCRGIVRNGAGQLYRFARGLRSGDGGLWGGRASAYSPAAMIRFSNVHGEVFIDDRWRDDRLMARDGLALDPGGDYLVATTQSSSADVQAYGRTIQLG